MTNCAGQRGAAFESRPAHKSPDFGSTRKSAISGDVVEGIRKSGFRDLVMASYGGGILGSVARLEGVSGENGAPCLAAQLVKFRTPFSPAEPDFGPE